MACRYFAFTFAAFCNITRATAAVAYSRGDKNAYLAARKSNFHIDPIHSRQPKPKTDTRNYDDPNPCTTYLAPSSIPNAGLGVYTSIPLPANTLIGSSQIGIIIEDYKFHHPDRVFRLIENYSWSTNSQEVSHSDALYLFLGSMANCHYGLINVDFRTGYSNSKGQDGTDSLAIEGGKHSTLGDVGRGAFTWHSDVRYHSLEDLQAGEEMFISYGPQWYEQAEK
jgi:hypothetical protein